MFVVVSLDETGRVDHVFEAINEDHAYAIVRGIALNELIKSLKNTADPHMKKVIADEIVTIKKRTKEELREDIKIGVLEYLRVCVTEQYWGELCPKTT